jgi:glutamate carboxypeptidase
MAMPSADEILSGIRTWVELESPTKDPGKVNQMMDMVMADYEGMGASTHRIPGIEGRGDHLSVASPWGGDEKGILVLSHLDTVHPVGTIKDLEYRVEGDKAYGPGIYDMKGGAYLALAAYRSLVDEGKSTPLPIRFLYVSDEEVGSTTSREHIKEAGKQAKYVLVTEPARDGGKIVTGRRGSARFVMTTHGRPSHSGSRHAEGRSAILEMAKQIAVIESKTNYDRNFTINVGMIDGGTAVNVIPEHCRASLDFRFRNLEVGEEMIAWVQGLKSNDPDITFTVDGGLSRPPFEKTPAIEELFLHAKNLSQEIGFELVDSFTGGGSDGNFLADTLPVLDGLGVDGEGAHTLHEHLLISSLVPRMTLMRRLFETLQ